MLASFFLFFHEILKSSFRFALKFKLFIICCILQTAVCISAGVAKATIFNRLKLLASWAIISYRLQAWKNNSIWTHLLTLTLSLSLFQTFLYSLTLPRDFWSKNDGRGNAAQSTPKGIFLYYILSPSLNMNFPILFLFKL